MTKKPLELIDYTRRDDGAYIDWENEHAITIEEASAAAKRKRFSDAELAAETYRWMLNACGESGMAIVHEPGTPEYTAMFVPLETMSYGPFRRVTHQLGIMRRFGTNPSYDEMDN